MPPSLNTLAISAAASISLFLITAAAYRLGQRSNDKKPKRWTRKNHPYFDKLAKEMEEDCSNSTKASYSSLQPATFQPIGEVSSVYRLCVGTPRQGLLAPHSRGRIDIFPNRISADSIKDLDKFSHVWVVFIFHLNSNAHVVSKTQNSTDNDGGEMNGSSTAKQRQFPAKIAPPALGGKRVGVFSTRTPHRPNPVGFSLCKIDSITIPKKKRRQKGTDPEPCSIHISGLDLVDGTPVLDIKPYVPHYDSVGYVAAEEEEGEENLNDEKNQLKLPAWVSEGLTKRRNVTFSIQAERDLQIMMKRDKLYNMEFYGVTSGRDKSIKDSVTSIKACIVEVLGADVRSAWQTKKARKGKFQAERSNRVKEVIDNGVIVQSPRVIDNKAQNGNEIGVNMCTQQLDNLLIKYTVNELEKGGEGESGNEGGAVNTDGSGADDAVTVQSIEPISQRYEEPDEDKINFSSAFEFWSKATTTS